MSTLRRALTSAFFLSGLLILSSAFAPPYRSAARGAPKCAWTARPAQPDRPPVVLFPFQLGLLLKPRAFFLALTTAEPLTCHLRQQPHPLTVMRSRRAVMSLGLFTDSLHLRCSASQLVHEMRRPRNFQ